MNPLPGRRIFISYSHRGKGPEWKAALLRALQVFEQQHLLDVWEDGKIRVSSYWEDDIERAMDEAALAVVLLTPEALQSEFILIKELPRLRDRQRDEHLPVFPVICEDCDWRAHDWLQATQAPNGSNPLSALQPEAQERAFRQLATAIAEELSRIALGEPMGDTSPPGDDHLYLDKFPLTRGPGLREERLIGREQELALLDLAFAQPHTAIVSLVAWGGVGKTMLVQHWLQRLQREGWFGASRVFAWSFYSQGTQEDRQASEDLFLAHALDWFGVQCEPTLSPWDKGRLLADAVSRDRTLLILDGIEPLQYPPGPMGGQLRAPGVQSLLKQLARKASALNQALSLVTTREPLTDLADFQRREGSPWGSVLRVDLGNLIDEAGAALLHHAGAKRAGAAEIKPGDTELLAASREVDGHALTLNLLGRFLARAHGGDIRRRDLVKFDEADRKEQGGTTFKMLAAFESWFAKSGEFGARQLAVLRILGLFDRPADAGCINALRNPPVIAGLTDPLFHTKSVFLDWGRGIQPLPEEEWNTATSFLTDFALVDIQTEEADGERLLNCHPLIREHFAARLRQEEKETWRSANHRLYDHLKDTTEDKERPTLTDLIPLYRAAAHGCSAGLYEEALLSVYSRRILRGDAHFSWRCLGAYGTELGLLVNFFATPWIQVVSDLDPEGQAWLLNEAAYCLRCVGRSEESLQTLRLSLDQYAKLGQWSGAVNAGYSIVELELTLGHLSTATETARKSIKFAELSRLPFWPLITQAILATALHCSGQIDEAVRIFSSAEDAQRGIIPDAPPFLCPPQGFMYCDVLLHSSEHEAWIRQLAPQPSNLRPQPDAKVLDCCQDVQIRAGTYLQVLRPQGTLREIGLAHLVGARGAMFQALMESSEQKKNSFLEASQRDIESANDTLRRGGEIEDVVSALMSRAWLRVLEGDTGGAQADLDEAWEIASRGPMRLHMADIHLYRARLFFREKVYPWESPQEDLAVAEKLINECGYHRRDEELADAKKAILGANA